MNLVISLKSSTQLRKLNQSAFLYYNQNMLKVVSKALIKNRDGKYLLLYRGDTHPNFPGHLDLPGGEVETKETPRTTTAREIQEETGICVNPNSLNMLFTKQYRNTKHILFGATIDDIDTSIELSWEHKDYSWMTLAEILNADTPVNVDPYYVDVINYLAKVSAI